MTLQQRLKKLVGKTVRIHISGLEPVIRPAEVIMAVGKDYIEVRSEMAAPLDGNSLYPLQFVRQIFLPDKKQEGRKK